MARPGICILGNVLTDLIITGVPALPAWGQETAGVSHRFVASGQAGYMARALAALGTPPSVISVVGDDDGGRTITATLQGAGVDVSSISVSADAPTALSVAIVRPDGERAFVSNFGALAQVQESYVSRCWSTISAAGTLAVAGLLNLPGLTLDATRRILARARAEGIGTMLDTGWDPAQWPPETVDGVRTMLAEVDLFLPNDAEAQALTGKSDPEEAAAVLAADGAGLVVIKCGPRGCIARRGEHVWTAPAVAVEVQDTVGAGDVFDSGLLHALGQGDDVPAAIAWANATAALYVSRTHDRFPTPEEVACALERSGVPT